MVNTLKMAPLFNVLGLIGVVLTLSACSTEPTTWEKSSSPWEQRSAKEKPAAAPAAETYKVDLEMPAETTNEVELSYQTESVDSFAPAVAAESAGMPLELASEGVSIMDQPADYYTMQLMASVDIDRVIRFANDNQISTQYIVATDRGGVIWHVLLLDVYSDYSSAVTARDEIAPSLKNVPWIRKVGSVQKLVR